jgi:DNA-binding protein H-NS
VQEVARQLAARTIVEWFRHLTFDRQSDVLAQIQQEHERSRSNKRSELMKQLSALGYGAPTKHVRTQRTQNGNGAAQRHGKKRFVKVKYRDPKTNEKWSGRGRMANWLKSKQEAGEKIEKYLV